MSNYVIKSRRLRIYLQNKGFDCRVTQDKNNPTKDIYLFLKSNLLLEIITDYTNSLHNKKNKII